MDDIAIHWFRQDLRLSDNPSLTMASQHDNVLPIYILDESNANSHSMGGASKWWLESSLQSLNKSIGGKLSVYEGNPIDILKDIISRLNISGIYWNRCYEPWRIQRDTKIKKYLDRQNIKAESFNGSLLWEPWNIKNKNGRPYGVFTPFYRKGCLQQESPRKPLAAPKNSRYFFDSQKSIDIDQLKLLSNFSWHEKLNKHWVIGEKGASVRLKKFIDRGLPKYKKVNKSIIACDNGEDKEAGEIVDEKIDKKDSSRHFSSFKILISRSQCQEHHACGMGVPS